MKDVLTIIEELRENGSSLKKIEILKENGLNSDLQMTFYKALNPFINFWIKKIPNYVPYDESISKAHCLDWGLKRLDDLINRKFTGNAGIDHLRSTLEQLNEKDAKVIEHVIERDLKCNVSVSTVNKVWKKLIPKFDVMLASKSTEKLMEELEYPVYVQDKEDGMRCVVIVKDGAVNYYGRSGKEIELHGNMVDSFLLLSNEKNVVFDGELLVRREGQILDRQTGNGILNKAIRGTISPEEANEIIIRLWDKIDYDDFQEGKSLVKEKNRYSSLRLDYANWLARRAEDPKIQLLSYEIAENLEELEKLFYDAVALKKEGIIVKNPYGIWEAKRSKNWIKVKDGFYKDAMIEMDLKVVGWNEGTGRHKGMLGSFTVENKDGTIRTNVGTGFSDVQRKEYTEEFSLGKIVKVRSTGVIQVQYLILYAKIKSKQTDISQSRMRTLLYPADSVCNAGYESRLWFQLSTATLT